MRILHGDCLALLPTLPANSIDAIVTDPPYCLTNTRMNTVFCEACGAQGLSFDSAREPCHKCGGKRTTAHKRKGFMNQAWDDDIAFLPDVWEQCLRVLKPGGHMAVFGGSRTHHRVWVAVEDAGFEIRDTLMWLYGSGFPKNLDVSKAIDKAAGAHREVIGPGARHNSKRCAVAHGGPESLAGGVPDVTAPATPEAEQWQGWGTALKPSHEPILLARKPLEGHTVAANVLTHGTGALNIDASRVPSDGGHKRPFQPSAHGRDIYGVQHGFQPTNADGRWPPNLLLDGSEEVVECFPHTKSGDLKPYQGAPRTNNTYGGGWPSYRDVNQKGDEGSAARFFPALGYSDDERRVLYCAKASKRDRAGSKHPTVKPIKLIEWLCKLICPPNGTILDPFAGSGTTGQAAISLGFDVIMIERETEYYNDILARFQPTTIG